jgi:hypothetical protein
LGEIDSRKSKKVWKKVEVGEEGICIRDEEEKRDDKVRQPRIVTAQYTRLCCMYHVCMDVLDGYDTHMDRICLCMMDGL